jgi:serine/threonine protein kinase
MFEGKSKLLNVNKIDSVRKAVYYLNKYACTADHYVAFSASSNRYFLLFQKGTQAKTYTCLSLRTKWDEDQSIDLCNKGEESAFLGDAVLLDTTRFKSVKDAVAVLNFPHDHAGSDIYAHVNDFCVVLDEDRLKYTVLYQEHARDKVITKFNLTRKDPGLLDFLHKGCFSGLFGEMQETAPRKRTRTSTFDAAKLVSTYDGLLAEKYDTVRPLGSGAQGTTFLVKRRGTSGLQQLLVAKEAKDTSAHGIKELTKEFEKMRELRHPNCLKVIELVQCPTEQQLFVLTEFAKGGDLACYMRVMRESSQLVDERLLAKILKQAMLGVAHLHACGITHRDLKPENLLAMDEFRQDAVPRIVIGDYGLATFDTDTRRITFGDPRFLAPEALHDFLLHMRKKLAKKPARLSEKQVHGVDIWAMGVTLYCSLTGDVLPFLYDKCSLHDLKDVFAKFSAAVMDSNVQLEFSEWNFSPGARALLQAMLTKKFEDRPSAREVIAHSWFQVEEVQEIPDMDHIVFESIRDRVRQILRNAVASKLQYQLVEDCHRTFAAFDPDFSGKIDRDEFKAAWTTMGKLGADEFFAMADVDANGHLDFNEFVALSLDWSTLDGTLLTQYLEMVCDDMAHGVPDSKFDLQTFRKLFEGHLGECESLDMAMQAIDSNHDGSISIDELKCFLVGSDAKRAKLSLSLPGRLSSLDSLDCSLDSVFKDISRITIEAN